MGEGVIVGVVVTTFLLLSYFVTGTRDVSSPSNGVALRFSVGREKVPACRMACGNVPIVGPDALKVRLGRRGSLVSSFQVGGASASAFSRA